MHAYMFVRAVILLLVIYIRTLDWNTCQEYTYYVMTFRVCQTML